MSENGEVSTEDAKRVLQEEAQERVEACRAELEQLLEKHRCRLSVAMLLTEKGNLPRISIEPVD